MTTTNASPALVPAVFVKFDIAILLLVPELDWHPRR
jgi:hypothetical protein